jgi:hypothetical protein
MALPMTTPPGPAHICLATQTAEARLIIRETTNGGPVMWPLLATRCPYTPWWQQHTHIHYLCDTWPAGGQLKLAPCNRQPYMITIGRA